MSKENYTHIVVILDRSGSMYSIADDMRGGFDSFIEEQKKVDGTATVTLVQFSNASQEIYNMLSLDDVPPLELEPRGGTALVQTMGDTINSTIEQMDSMDENEKPEKCIFLIITDGQDNVASTYTKTQIDEMVSELEDADEGITYDFVYMGANQDAIRESGSVGVRSNATMNYSADSVGTRSMFNRLSSTMTSYRGSADHYSFQDNNDSDDSNEQNDDDEQILDHVDFLTRIDAIVNEKR